VALAWLLRQPAVSSIIVGPKSVNQWKDNVAACDVSLTHAQLTRLDEVSASAPKYPEWFIPAMSRNQPQ
jgi:aryl-alcohol dehydrogenase-like predicted oxidoreductase